LNGLSGGWGNTSDASALSRKSKADRIFRLLTKCHHANDAISQVLYPFTQRTFLGEDESDFRRNDNFVSPLVDLRTLEALRSPQRYLMIPYDALPRNRPRKLGVLADY